jgi:undecaprenyl-phosphate galactose phosphotransferase
MKEDVVNIKDYSILKTIRLYLYLGIKRVFDIVVSLIGLIFLLPITIVVKICYLCTGDFGRIFFTQKRIGKNGKEFKFFKFRSMVKNADEILFKLLEENEELREEYRINKKLKDDPRITKIGKILRKTSLDELPQIINIFLGHMSLIGNRPYLPREKEDMGDYFDDILKTKPGLTGYWQVSGRSNTTFEERLKLEKYYSEHCGLRMDIKIFFKTFAVVLLRKGADK